MSSVLLVIGFPFKWVVTVMFKEFSVPEASGASEVTNSLMSAVAHSV
jgi:hypothetical protein